jgi:hypothetical protein
VDEQKTQDELHAKRNQIDRLPDRRNNLLPDEVGGNKFFKGGIKRSKEKAGNFERKL